MNKGQAHVVNERVSGTRHFSVSGMSPISHDPYKRGTRSTVTLWTKRCDWNAGTIHSEQYGMEFDNGEAWHEHCLVHGYTRPYFTSDQMRVKRVLDSLHSDLINMSRIYDLTDRQIMVLRARLKRAGDLSDVVEILKHYKLFR